MHPDVDCAHLIVQSGIKEVLYDEMLSSKRIKDLKQLSCKHIKDLKQLSSPTDNEKLKTFRNAIDILRLGRVALRYVKNFLAINFYNTSVESANQKLKLN